jgi:ABC-2 type transport system ATP-binding protein
LDPKQVAEIRDLIKELRGQHTIILSTHILPEVQATCEKVVIISKGKIVAFGMGVSLSVPMGCFIAYRILEKGQLQNSAGILLAVSAGTFLYIAACDLLPELHRSDTEKMKRLFAFLFGLLIAFVSGPLMGG